MKVMVTGAFGNIGQNTVEALIENGHEAICFDLKSERNEAASRHHRGQAKLAWGDITRVESIATALATSGAEAVVHLAAIIPPTSEIDPELAYRVNVTGTKNLIAALQQSSQCKRVVFASSTAVHGSNFARQPPLTVDCDFLPEDEYARHKVEAEIALHASGLEWTILRVAATPPLNTSAAQKGSLKMLFDVPSSGRMEFLHGKDAGLAFANAAACDEAVHRVMFLGGGRANGCQLSGYEFVCMMTRGSGLGVLPKKAFSADPDLIHADWVDTADSQQLLKYQRHGPDDMVREIKQQAGSRYYLVRILAPLARYLVLKKSPYYQQK